MYRPPTIDEWKALEEKFSCEFPSGLRSFIELMAEFDFPGDIMNVGDGPNNGNDGIELTYDFEIRENPAWLSEMIPFYAIGNGDYFCVSSREGPSSAIYYYDHERNEFTGDCPDCETWLKALPDFLAS